MFQDINIEKELISLKSKNEKLLLNSAIDQLNNDLNKEKTIQKNINSSNNKKYFANIKIEDTSNVYSFETIEKIAIKHRLRFLPTKFFKNQIPQEAIFKIKEIEKSNSIEIKKFFILAPSSAFDLEDCNKDPLLFIPLKNNLYYLVHKWGSDLSWLKKLTAIPFRTL